MTLDSAIRQRVEEWLKPPFDSATRDEIQRLLDADNEKDLYDRFYADLEFGTGGLRGIMGAGLNRMNVYVVGRASQGLANYILKNVGEDKARSVAIAYDSRNHSMEFAKESAAVFAGNGLKVFLFESLRPTPELSFAVRHLGATAGVVVTASHNPKEYNGYKVYWSDGGQIVPPHDKGIIGEVKAITDFGSIVRADYDKAVAEGRIVIIGKDVDEAFYEAILRLSVRPDVCVALSDRLKIIYTPLHGSGISLVPEALRRWGFQNVRICEAQRKPDGNFPTTPSPNPEEKAALAEAIATAQAFEGDLVLATDPDCDRVGIAVRADGKFELMSGNQVAAMLVDYVLSSRADQGVLPKNAAAVKTIVTTELIAAICRHWGVRLDNVLTGFKYIGEKIRLFEETGEGQFLVGGEESYGYLVGTHARDKDAVVCSCFIAEMAAESLSRGETLLNRLDALYMRYGIFQESLMSMTFAGAEGVDKIRQIMKTFREDPPKEFLGSAVVEIRDYQEGSIRDILRGEVTGKTGLPKSNVLIFVMGNGAQIVARPSGTEPKIKFYFSVSDTERLPIKTADELAERKAQVSLRHENLRKEFSERVQQIAGQ